MVPRSRAEEKTDWLVDGHLLPAITISPSVTTLHLRHLAGHHRVHDITTLLFMFRQQMEPGYDDDSGHVAEWRVQLVNQAIEAIPRLTRSMFQTE